VSFLAYPLALAAAAAFATAIPLEHRAAAQAPDSAGMRPRQLVSFVRATVRNRWWLTGMVFNVLAFGLHALALNFGSLAVVQPLLVTNVLFALPINHLLRKEPVKAAELAWAAALVTGLAGFLLIATGGIPVVSHTPARTPAVAAAVLVILVCAALVMTARRSGRRSTAATLLGIATGIAFAVTASLIKVVVGIAAAHGPVAVLTSWQVYAMLATSGTGVLLNQLAFQAGPLSASLPAMMTVDPLVSVLLAVLVFDENLRHTPLAITGEVFFLLLLAVAVYNLSRLERLLASDPAAPAAEQPSPSPSPTES
jgi:drug/metabolite transporter (DMT)-like permease